MPKVELSRLESTILYVLLKAKEKGIKDLSRFELFKLIYLIEVNSYRFIGESFTNQVTFVRDKNGPISQEIYRANERLETLGIIDIQKQDNLEYGYPRYCHSLKEDDVDFGFVDSEIVFLNSVLEDFLGKSQTALKTVVYDTEPMQAIQAVEKRTKTLLKGAKVNLEKVPLDEDILTVMIS